MTISYSISNTINYNTVGIGVDNPATTFPAIYGNIDFGYTVTFSQTDGPIVNLTVVSSPAYAPATVLSANSVRIARNMNIDVFTNELYSFVTILPPGQKQLVSYPPALTSQADLETSVYDWDMPPIKEVTGSYSFTITHFDSVALINTNVTSTFTKRLVWSQFPGLTMLRELVARSRW